MGLAWKGHIMYYKNEDEIKRVNEFIQEINNQLAKMTELEKDEWIIRTAQLLNKDKQRDFLKSLSGEKFILHMPENVIIDEFCKQVNEGKIFVEYETHYYEFDDDGRYMDDWKVWYNDPHQAMDFIDNILRGCHDLNKLGEYEQTNKILGKICRLEFCIENAENSEDSSEDEDPFTLNKAYEQGMLHTNKTEVVYDWIYAFYMANIHLESKELAGKLIELFMLPLCEVLLPSNVCCRLEDKEVHNEMISLLETAIEEDTKAAQIEYERKYTWEIYYAKERLKRENKLIEDLKNMQKEKLNTYNQISITKPEIKREYQSYIEGLNNVKML